jgi:hypothetical protein
MGSSVELLVSILIFHVLSGSIKQTLQVAIIMDAIQSLLGLQASWFPCSKYPGHV